MNTETNTIAIPQKVFKEIRWHLIHFYELDDYIKRRENQLREELFDYYHFTNKNCLKNINSYGYTLENCIIAIDNDRKIKKVIEKSSGKFEIKNNGSSQITANTSSKGVSIKLTVGDKTVAESATLLKNDILQLKNVSINAGTSYTAAAIFQVPESNISAISGATAVISVNGASIGTINIQ